MNFISLKNTFRNPKTLDKKGRKNINRKILKNDLKLINALIQQYPIKPYYRDQSIHSTQYKIDYVQEQLEILDFIQQNKQKTAIPKPEPTPQKRREDDFEPPSPF